MYCPNCAAPIDGVKFCRSCGANVSLVPEAISGRLEKRLEESARPSRHRRGKKPPSVESAVTNFFTGLAFLIVSLAIARFFPGGRYWWFWLLIPALACMGEGIGRYLRWRQEERATLAQHDVPQAPPPALPHRSAPQIKAPTTSELKAPPGSVTGASGFGMRVS